MVYLNLKGNHSNFLIKEKKNTNHIIHIYNLNLNIKFKYIHEPLNNKF